MESKNQAIRALAFAATLLALVVSHAPATTGAGFRCAVQHSQWQCFICDNCKLDPNSQQVECGTVIGGIQCTGDKHAVCSVEDDGWTAECVTAP